MAETAAAEGRKGGRRRGGGGKAAAAAGDRADEAQGSRGDVKTFADGKYEGQVKSGRREGVGTCTYSWGGSYTGEWKNDKRHGKGKLSDKWGGDYDGEWANDKKDGRGVNLWSNGRRYEGQWKNDEMQGEGRWRWPDGSTFQGTFAADCPLAGLLLEGDAVFKVRYTGQTDIADPALKPDEKEKDTSDAGAAFKKAAMAWEARLNAVKNIDSVRRNTAEAREEMAKIKAEAEAAAQEQSRAAKDAEENSKLSTLAEKDAADALTTAMDLESKAKEARDKAEKLKKSAAEKTHAAKKAAAESEKANKKADERSRAKAECVRRLVSLEKELKSMEAILSEADTSSPAIVDAGRKQAEAASPPKKEKKQTGPKGGKAADRDRDGGADEGGLVRVNIAVGKTGLVTCAIRLAE